eukprot:5536015-Pyramimonas_sp.AAC.1
MRVGRTGGLRLPPSALSSALCCTLWGLSKEVSPSSLSGCRSGNPPRQGGRTQSIGWRRPHRLTGGTPKESSRCA